MGLVFEIRFCVVYLWYAFLYLTILILEGTVVIQNNVNKSCVLAMCISHANRFNFTSSSDMRPPICLGTIVYASDLEMDE